MRAAEVAGEVTHLKDRPSERALPAPIGGGGLPRSREALRRRATLPSCHGALFAGCTTRGTGNAAAIRTAGAGAPRRDGRGPRERKPALSGGFPLSGRRDLNS